MDEELARIRRSIGPQLYSLDLLPHVELSVAASPEASTLPMYEALMTIFAPFVSTVYNKNVVLMRARKDVFKRRLGITSDILEYIDNLHKEDMPCILAGGKLIDFVNNVPFSESVNDYDLWSVTEQEYFKLCHGLGSSKSFKALANKGHVSDWIDKKADRKLQVINNIYAEPFDVLLCFDIRACAVAYDGEYIYWVKGALKDIKQKKITILNMGPRRTTFVRIEKYLKRGYSIDVPDLGLAAITFLGSMTNNHNTFEFYTNRKFSYLEAMEIAHDYPTEI